MKYGRCLIFLLMAGFLFSVLSPDEAEAIPAFARRYKISCTTCHAPVPKLKPYGDEFAGNGFVIPEEEKARDYVSAGDELLWLNRDFPIAARFDAYAVYEDDRSAENDLETPWGLKLLSGGTLYRGIGYYFYFYLSERGEVAGIEDAYIHFNNIGGSDLDIMVGQFQTSDPLMKRELRLTFEDYQIYKTSIGESETNLAYDRGIMATYGVAPTSTDLVAFVVNGNGKEEASSDRKYDKDDHKNVGFRLSQGIGEYASVGGYVYYGKEEAGGGNGELSGENEITYWGPDLNVAVGPVEVTGQYLLRKDTNPLFQGEEGEEIETEGIVAELVVAPPLGRSRFYLVGLYNRIDSDLDDFDYETATAGVSFVLARNLRLVGEYTRDIEEERNRFVTGFVSGF